MQTAPGNEKKLGSGNLFSPKENINKLQNQVKRKNLKNERKYTILIFFINIIYFPINFYMKKKWKDMKFLFVYK